MPTSPTDPAESGASLRLADGRALIVVPGAGTALASASISRAAVTKAHADIATLEQGIEMYRLDNQRYPTTAEGLQALVAGRYIPRLPDDPWRHPYRYAAPGQGGKPFTVASWGADGREGGTGDDADITN